MGDPSMPPGPPMDAGMGGGPPGMPAAPQFPTTDPNSLAALVAAILAQDANAFQQAQVGSLGTAVQMLMAQQPNPAGEAAASMPGGPVPPPMPSGPADASMDPSAAAPGY